jgi:bis(5'-nucleosidyl)-tetraphosphatase
MNRHTAAGFVLARVVGDEPYYLLLRGANSGNWLPPKGHTDDDEDVLSTALRETAEETGITELQVVDGFSRTIAYNVNTRRRGKYTKQVTYLLATTPTPEVRRSGEHSDAGWFTLADALDRIEFDQMREVLRAADAALRKHLRKQGATPS